MVSDWKANPRFGSFALSALLFTAACAGDEPVGTGTGGPVAGAAPTSMSGSTMSGTLPPGAAAGNASTPPPGMAPIGVGGAPTNPPGGTGPISMTPPDGEPPAVPPSNASPHWTSYGGGPKNQFYNAAETKISVETAPMLKKLWNVAIGEITGAPAVVGDRVYVVSNSGTLALNAKDGSMIWRAAFSGTSAPYYDEASKQLIVVTSANAINALDIETGAMKWSQRVSTQGGTGWTSPIVTGNLAVAGVGAIDNGGFKGGASAFDLMTGMKAWEYTHATSNGASVWSGPGADDDGVIYATTGNNYQSADDRSDSIFAVSAKGEMLWNFQAEKNDVWSLSGGAGPDHDFGANPIIVDVKGRKLIAAGAKSGVFHLLDRMTGQPIASAKVSERSSQANGGILNNGAYDGKNQIFLVGANEGGAPGSTVGLSADPDMMLKELWRIKNTGILWAPFSTANGVCFVTDNSTLRVLNCADGMELTTVEQPGTIGSAPAISDGRVFYGAGFSYQFGGGTIRAGRDLVALGFE
jgi:polyvinyl alcohol dehydrogenase (cytochrome)